MTRSARLVFHAPLATVKGPGARPPERSSAETTAQETSRVASELAMLSQRIEDLESAVGELPAIVSRRLDEVAALATEMGLTIAGEILNSRIEKGEFDLVPVITSALKAVVGGTQEALVTVFLNAADLGPVLGRLRPEKQDKPSPFHFEVDPLLARGTVRIETDSGRLKYDPREVLARLRQDLCRTALR